MFEGRNLSSIRYSYYKGEADQARLYGPRCISCMTKAFNKNRLEGVDLLYVPTPNGHIPVTMRSLVFFNGIQNPFMLKDFTEDVLSPECTRCLRRVSKESSNATLDIGETKIESEQENKQIASLPISQLPQRITENDASLTEPASTGIKRQRSKMVDYSMDILNSEAEIIDVTPIDASSRSDSENDGENGCERKRTKIGTEGCSKDGTTIVVDQPIKRILSRQFPDKQSNMPFLYGKIRENTDDDFYTYEILHYYMSALREKLATDEGFPVFLCKKFPEIENFETCHYCNKTMQENHTKRLSHVLSLKHIKKAMDQGHIFPRDWNLLKGIALQYLRKSGQPNFSNNMFNFSRLKKILPNTPRPSFQRRRTSNP